MVKDLGYRQNQPLKPLSLLSFQRGGRNAMPMKAECYADIAECYADI